MDVVLPSTGCNIINSATSFYNYSNDGRTRDTYVIYEGVAHLQSSNYNQYGYNYTGTCLSTGDLTYKPETKVYFEALSIFLLFLCFGLVLYLFFIKWWRKV